MAYISLTGGLFFVFDWYSGLRGPPEGMAACAISSRSTRSTPTGASCIAGPDVVSITPQVFDLLDYLIRNRERVVSKDDLINAIWNGRIVSDAALTTRLNAARGAIGDSGEEQRLIKTLPRKGFRFVGQVREAREVAGPNPGDAPESAPAASRQALHRRAAVREHVLAIPSRSTSRTGWLRRSLPRFRGSNGCS